MFSRKEAHATDLEGNRTMYNLGFEWLLTIFSPEKALAAALRRHEQNITRPHQTSLDSTGRHWTSPDFTGLYQTSPEFMEIALHLQWYLLSNINNEMLN